MSVSGSDPVMKTVERGHTRAVTQATLGEIALAGTIALLGPLLVAVFGTDWLPVGLIAVFAAAGLMAGGYRWLRRRPSRYGVAQHIDSAWETDDQISTAYYFALHPSEAGPLARVQREQAAPLAASGDLALALPLVIPRSGYVFAAMLLMLLVLLGLRYGTQSSFSLQPPLIPVEAPALYADAGHELRREDTTEAKSHGEEPSRSLRKESKLEKSPNTAEPDPVPDVIEGETPIGDALGEGSSALPEVEGISIDDEFGDELVGGSGEGGEEQEDSETRDPSRQSSESDPNSEAGSAGQGAENEVSNDLLSRLEDAFRNMLSSLNMDPPSGSDPADSSEQQSGQPSPAEGAK